MPLDTEFLWNSVSNTHPATPRRKRCFWFFLQLLAQKERKRFAMCKPITKREKTPLVVFSLFFVCDEKFTLFRALSNDKSSFARCDERRGRCPRPATFLKKGRSKTFIRRVRVYCLSFSMRILSASIAVLMASSVSWFSAVSSLLSMPKAALS